MWKIHVMLALLTATALAGCASGPAAEMPQGVTLTGSWKLDRAASDDPQVVVARMRAQAWKIIRRASASMDTGPPPGGPRGGQGGPPADPSTDQSGPLTDPEASGPGSPGGRPGPRPDPLQRSPMMHALSAALARGDFLSVRASNDEFVLDYGGTVRSFTPGARSVVSSEMGVADRRTGWRGRAYVIEDRAQIGPNVIESYALSADGQRLIEKLKIGPAELPAIELKRIYGRTTEAAPRSLPTTD